MLSSRNKLALLLVALVLAMLSAGCIADTAEDSDLPWASNNRWEGMTPMPASMMNQYD